jgi:tetratricopeptide (TPR) repeat protein
MDPWDYIKTHRYEDALAAYNEQIAGSPEVEPVYFNRAIALLCLGRLSEALEDWERVSEKARQNPLKTSPELEWLGLVLWLMGYRTTAKEMFRAAMDGVRYGTIAYGDAAGGVGQGLLLWYAGVTTRDTNATEHALTYLSRLSKKKTRMTSVENWPGPLALYAIEQLSLDDILRKSFESGTVGEAALRAKDNILLRRQLAQTLLAVATRHRTNGNERDSRSALVQCSRLENPHIEAEWYLAAAEVGVFRLSSHR